MFTEAQLYQESSGPQQKKALQMLLDYQSWLQWSEDESILDIGSGPGNITEHLLLPFLPDSIRNLVGVDKSEAMVDYARKLSCDPRIDYYQMDITDKDQKHLTSELPESLSGGFDKVFCFYLLHWMEDMLPQALSNIHHLMKPGGQGLAIQYSKIPVYDVYVDIGKSKKWAPLLDGVPLEYNPLRTCKEPYVFMEKRMEDAGLKADHIDCYSSYNVYRSRTELKGIMQSIDPFLQYLPDYLQEEYMDDFLDTLIQRTARSEEGYICVPFTIMTVAFSKPL